VRNTAFALTASVLRGLRASREAQLLTAILALATVLRVVWVLYAARSPQELHDPFFYLLYAGRIADGDGYTLLNGEPTAYYPVGYPASLAGVFWLVEHTPLPDHLWRAAGFYHIFLSVATVGLAWYVGRRLLGPAVGLLAALWLAVYPNLIYHTAAYLSETLFNFLVMAALAVLVSGAWPRGAVGRGRLLAFGVLLGLSALVRPISLLLLPALLVVWLGAGGGWRRALGQTAAVLAVTVAVILPWSIRNFVVMDAPIGISANLGDDLCMGHHPNAPGHFALPDFCFAGYEHLPRPEYEVRRNDDNIRRAVRFAIDHPGYELKLLSKKARYLWESDHDGLWAVESYGDDPFIDPTLRTVLARVADTFFFVTISLGGLGLLAFVLPPRDPRRVFTLLALLAFAGVPLAFFGDSRFHIPAMPLIVFAAAWSVVAAAGLTLRLVARASAPASRTTRSGVDVAEGERPVPEQDAL
jgi:4-amino-4-deoxy-L-arabinose transferase-like glycosyltransferase